MAITNRDRVGKALDVLREGLSPFADREFKSTFKGKVKDKLLEYLSDDHSNREKSIPDFDVAGLLKLMIRSWNDVYRATLGSAERSYVGELQNVRNKWAHQEPFSGDDTYRALDTVGRLLTAISSPNSDAIEKMKTELLRLRYDEQARTEKRKGAGTTIESQEAKTLVPWREVITPHKDVASGKYQQAEFAADLWQVHMGEGSDEYLNPKEFFRRTYLTESLKQLLERAIDRLNGKGGDPVVQLQTNFGGGKTHSMLALYHLFSGIPPADLAGMDQILSESDVASLPKVKRVVLVGNKISPGNPVTKDDGTRVNTLWGEIAWQLDGAKGYNRIKADDEKATNPGDTFRELLKENSPCMILIDEWVAYARQLHDQSDLPAGSFETQFTFAQLLTESVKLVDNCLVVVSLPASDTAASPHTQADNIEVGGQRGQEALSRLQNVIGRVESSWRPASAEEGFEIVRRRLFEPLVEKKQFVNRDLVASAFFDMYRTQHTEFPSECHESGYEERIKNAYPIHPEIFDRLYTDWSTLIKFQRTRGVLRLMASVIHSLWANDDRNPLIMPANIPIDDQRVQFELTRYLSDQWTPIIEKDVDGAHSLPSQIDAEVPNLGKYHACRRAARTIYLGSAPLAKASNQGLEDRQVKLGCVMPGESPAIFGDALRRMASKSTYLYQDGTRYWYSTIPTVTKIAEDRAQQYLREPDMVVMEIARRIRSDIRQTGDFSKIHPMPQGGQDIPDDLDARLVILGAEQPFSNETDCPAIKEAREIWEKRGNSPRIFRNTLVFLAIDRNRLQDLDEAVRHYLAWESIVTEKEALDLSPFHVKQAETQKVAADSVVISRLPEAYIWLIVPSQDSPKGTIEWKSYKLSGQEALAVRASKRLLKDELLITNMGAARLKMEIDRVPLWRGNHIEIKQLIEDFAKYLYLPRVANPEVILNAIRDGVSLLTWAKETFAYAEGYDETAKRYIALRGGRLITLTGIDAPGLIVKPEIAYNQIEEESNQIKPNDQEVDGPHSDQPINIAQGPREQDKPETVKYTRFHGSIELDSERAGRDAGKITDEVITHLVGIVNAEVYVTLEIEANVPGGISESVMRTVSENCRTLKFKTHGFEEE